MGARRTFVIHVYEGGPATVEDVRTGRQAAVVELVEVADRIGEWLDGGEADQSERLAGDDARLEA